MAIRDLGPADLADLSWDNGSKRASIDALGRFVRKTAQDAIAWYCKSRQRKKSGAIWSRAGAIVLGSLAAIVPLLSPLLLEDGKPWLSPAWASVSVALAAALIALDRFFGFSSGWTRYITTELRLHKLLDDFQIQWEAEKASWKGAEPDDTQVRRMLDKAKAFASQVHTQIVNETNAWVAEFQSTLRQLDEAAKAKAESDVPRLGALNVVVSNGRQCPGGWSLTIDDGTPRPCTGSTAAVDGLVPGTHTLKVRGTISSKPKQAETVVVVPPGGVATAELTLS